MHAHEAQQGVARPGQSSSLWHCIVKCNSIAITLQSSNKNTDTASNARVLKNE